MKQLQICGFEGRMGQEVARLAAQYGFDAQPLQDTSCDVIIDFSHPDALPGLLRRSVPLVCGTTGFTPMQQEALRVYAQKQPLFVASNFSIGIYLMKELSLKARAALPQADISLLERHHSGKKDRPSGTAKELSQALALRPEQVLSVRGGTVVGTHEITLYAQDEMLTLTHTAQSRAVFAHGALKAAVWLLSQRPGYYGMRDLLQ